MKYFDIFNKELSVGDKVLAALSEENGGATYLGNAKIISFDGEIAPIEVKCGDKKDFVFEFAVMKID